jgi:hypothetical protein
MRVICISDSHNRHADFEIPDGDVLVHAGDWTNGGTPAEIAAFLEWLVSQPHRHKVIIAGNHDLGAGTQPTSHRGVHYLMDSGVEIEGELFFGSPWSAPLGPTWAFARPFGRNPFACIPDEVAVLITHAPAKYTLDYVPSLDGGLQTSWEHAGSPELLKRVQDLEHLKLHVCGHLHEARGYHPPDHEIPYHRVNAALLDGSYRPVHRPIVVDI